MAGTDELAPEEVCQQCDGEIEGQPLYPTRDITMDDDGLVFHEPDGPFCSVDCRREFDGE